MNAFAVVEAFERRVAAYTGAPYAVAVDSATNGLFLCLRYLRAGEITLPRRTYCSVPMAVMHAGGSVRFEDREWTGVYQLAPFPLWDCAKRFRRGMYADLPHPPHEFVYAVVSFHARKLLNIGRGGMILTDDAAAVAWVRAARRDGRTDSGEPVWEAAMLGWNMYLTPEQAARGLMLLDAYEREHGDGAPDQVETYPDLSAWGVFRS